METKRCSKCKTVKEKQLFPKKHSWCKQCLREWAINKTGVYDVSDLPGEEWRPVQGLEGRFSVSNLGRVKSHEHLQSDSRGRTLLKRTKIISTKTHSQYGYTVFQYRDKGKLYMKSVHREVAKAFIPNPENKCCVNHINCVRDDNRVENLEWATVQENNAHTKSTKPIQNRIQVKALLSELITRLGILPPANRSQKEVKWEKEGMTPEALSLLKDKIKYALKYRGH